MTGGPGNLVIAAEAEEVAGAAVMKATMEVATEATEGVGMEVRITEGGGFEIGLTLA